MKVSEMFIKEIEKIENADFREFTRYYLDNYVPKYFAEIGASSSGKYHPKFSQGKGGLVRHTKAVVMFAEELMRMSSYAYLPQEYKDFIIVACICHDTAKYGLEDEMDKKAFADHATNAADNVAKAYFDFFNNECPFVLHNAIKSHMGQWSTNKEDRPFTSVDRCVHMADYMASRSFIDIAELSAECEG